MDRNYDNREQFSEMITELRSFGFSLSDLSRQFDVAPSYIRGIELKGSIPNWFLGEKIRKFYGLKKRVMSGRSSSEPITGK